MQISRKLKEELKSMSRQERKAKLRELRSLRKPYFDLAMQAKKLWEKIRSSKTPRKEKEAAIGELRELVKGKVNQLIYSHDTVRVIECMMTLDRAEIRAELFQSLRNQFLLLAKSKYAHFFVIKMLKHGTAEQRAEIMGSFAGHVVSLIRHPHGSEIVECAYNEWANAGQRATIFNEFYGKEFALFKSDKPLDLKELFGTRPEKREHVLGYMREILMAVSSKPSLQYSVVHRLLNEYLDHATPDARREMVETLKERVPELLHTRDGARSAAYCIWYGNVKERKTIVKSLKDNVVKICKEEFGHLFLFAVFDCVDDTVLIEKSILKELLNNLHEIAMDKHGLRILTYLLSPRNPRFFLPETILFLKQGDEFSKKAKDVRLTELRRAVGPQIGRYLANRMEEFAFEASKSLFVLTAMQALAEVEVTEAASEWEGEMNDARRACYAALGELAAEEFIPMNIDAARLHIVEHKHGHFLVSMLMRLDKKLAEAHRPTLSGIFAERLSAEELGAWVACKKGGFVLLNMYENGEEATREKVKGALKRCEKKMAQYGTASVLKEKVLAVA